MTDSVKITYFGQSCFYIQSNNFDILIDPGTGNIPSDISVNCIFATHEHTDHISQLKKVAKSNPEAVIIGNTRVLSKFKEITNEKKRIEDGDSLALGNAKMKFINCRHGLFKGVNNTGISLTFENGISIGHVGDAVEYEGFRNDIFDVLIIPISGMVTSSPKKALKELSEFKTLPKKIIPMHWLFRKPERFCSAISSQFGSEVECTVLKNNEHLIV